MQAGRSSEEMGETVFSDAQGKMGIVKIAAELTAVIGKLLVVRRPQRDQ